MSSKGLTILLTAENITKSLDKTKHTTQTVETVINSVAEQVAKANLTYEEAKTIFAQLDVLILTARDKDIITQEKTSYFHEKILNYQTIYSETPGMQEHVVRFIKRFMIMQGMLNTEDSNKSDYILRDFFYRERSIDMLPALKLVIDILKAFKTQSCKDVLEYRVGCINYSNDISRKSANYSDYLRLMNIASKMGWYNDDQIKVYQQRCREMSAQYRDENGVPLGFKGNEKFETLSEVDPKNVDYLDTNNFNR